MAEVRAGRAIDIGAPTRRVAHLVELIPNQQVVVSIRIVGSKFFRNFNDLGERMKVR